MHLLVWLHFISVFICAIFVFICALFVFICALFVFISALYLCVFKFISTGFLSFISSVHLLLLSFSVIFIQFSLVENQQSVYSILLMKNINLDYLLNMQLLYPTSFSTTMFTATDQEDHQKMLSRRLLRCRKCSGNSSLLIISV